GKGREDFGRGAAERAMPRDVTGKRRRDKGLFLIGDPVRSQYPADPAVVVVGTSGLPRPGKNGNRADRQPGVASAGLGGVHVDDFDQPGYERQAVGVERGSTGITGLTELAHVANGFNGTPAVIVTLERPGRTGGLVNRGVQSE